MLSFRPDVGCVTVQPADSHKIELTQLRDVAEDLNPAHDTNRSR